MTKQKNKLRIALALPVYAPLLIIATAGFIAEMAMDAIADWAWKR